MDKDPNPTGSLCCYYVFFSFPNVLRTASAASGRGVGVQVDPHTQKEAERRVELAAASVEEITQVHAKLQVRMREIEGGAERMRGEHRTLSGQMATLERQRGELAATVRVCISSPVTLFDMQSYWITS